MLLKADLKKKKIILRTDYNVPIKNNIITSTKRIDESLKTIKYIISQQPKQIIIISHLGRPKIHDKKLSLLPIKEYLENKLEENIYFAKNFENITDQKIIMLENIRFHPEETKILPSTNDFRNKLTNLGDIYINDAFGCSHREHSSIVGINCKEKYIGFLVEKEVKYLKNVFNKDGIYTLILGGSKVNDKIKLIKNLIPKVDNILIGGGMIFTFLKYLGYNTGSSLIDEEGLSYIEDIINYAKLNNTKLIYPIDFICNDNFSNKGNIQNFTLRDGIPKSHMGLDIGNKSINIFKEILSYSNTIIWNGPLGVFEMSNFSIGSKKIMEHISNLSNVTAIIGGGDTALCCEMFNCDKKVTHVSTGGGAALEMLEGGELPGIKFIT